MLQPVHNRQYSRPNTARYVPLCAAWEGRQQLRSTVAYLVGRDVVPSARTAEDYPN